MTIAYVRDLLLTKFNSKDVELIIIKTNLRLTHEIMTEYPVSSLEKYIDNTPVLAAQFF